MATNSTIEWTTHTFSPWWGCTQISPACDRCYAMLTAMWRGYKVWGKDAPRRFLSDDTWRKPHAWNRAARDAGERDCVFCASMCDVFERRADLDAERSRLWKLIEDTPHLDWQLLTKRPENVLKMVPKSWLMSWPPNVWIGATIENQRYANKRLKHLLRIPAPVRFVSCEPLLGSIDLTPFLGQELGMINWVISGGESKAGARPTALDWARDLRDQSVAADVAFHWKQWGSWRPTDESSETPPKRRLLVLGTEMERLTKKAAGRELDGRTWDQLPIVRLPKGWPEK